MKRFGYTWPELIANNAKLVRVFAVSDYRAFREE